LIPSLNSGRVSVGLIVKGGTKMRSSNYSTVFQQIFAAFCVLIAKICILLSFSVLASKFHDLLITTEALKTNRIQREFDSNVRIATFDHAPSEPKNKLSQTFR
jgi:hypothetical protein